jgi:hypothetical protein
VPAATYELGRIIPDILGDRLKTSSFPGRMSLSAPRQHESHPDHGAGIRGPQRRNEPDILRIRERKREFRIGCGGREEAWATRLPRPLFSGGNLNAALTARSAVFAVAGDPFRSHAWLRSLAAIDLASVPAGGIAGFILLR